MERKKDISGPFIQKYGANIFFDDTNYENISFSNQDLTDEQKEMIKIE